MRNQSSLLWEPAGNGKGRFGQHCRIHVKQSLIASCFPKQDTHTPFTVLNTHALHGQACGPNLCLGALLSPPGSHSLDPS